MPESSLYAFDFSFLEGVPPTFCSINMYDKSRISRRGRPVSTHLINIKVESLAKQFIGMCRNLSLGKVPSNKVGSALLH